MRRSWSPTIVPDSAGYTFYVVIEHYRGAPYIPETTLDRTDIEEVLTDLAAGQYSNPLEVVAFNPTEGWSKNVTEDIAAELRRRADLADEEPAAMIADFVERNTRRDRQLTLRLV